MEYWAELWNSLLNLISGHEQELIKNPIVWIFIALVGIGVYALYDVPDKVSKNGLGGIIRQLLQVILDTSSDIINALRSVTGFLGVVRLLLFGKLNQRTLQVLINYAIIFMSMASFSTTFAGLREMAGMVLAAFLSFGVQVSILICATKIANYKNKKNSEPERIITTHHYCFAETFSGLLALNNRVKPADADPENSNVNSEQKKIDIKLLSIHVVLTVSVFVSSSFSYSFMFGQFISPHLAYDDHFRSIREIQNIIGEYSEELNQYRTELVEILTRYNDNIEEWMDLKENSPYIQLEREKDLTNEIDELEDEWQQLNEEYYGAEEDSPERNALDDRLGTLEDRIEDRRGDLEDIRDELYEDLEGNSRRVAYESITALRNFYANPGEINAGQEKELRQSFAYLQQSEAVFQESEEAGQEFEMDDAGRTELMNAFENYMSLTKYLVEQGGERINFTEVQEKMGIDYSQDFSSADYQDATNDILVAMLNKLNSIPLLTSVENIWSENGNIIQVPPQTEYVNTINELYRDNSGQTLELERAVKKLFDRKKDKEVCRLCRILLLLAIIFDSLIIALTKFRERKYSLTDNAELRRMLGILFIDDSISREAERLKKSQSLCLALGFAAGILVFTIYQAGGYTQENSFEQNTFSLLCFIASGLILGLLICKIYYKIYNKTHNWEQENIYHHWKEIFLPDEKSEKRLKEKCERIKSGEEKIDLPSKTAELEDILAFWMSSLGRRLFSKYFYPCFILLFEEMEMKKCIKTSIVKELRNGKFTIIDVSTTEINLPCLLERSVAKAGAKVEFSILKRRHLVEFAFCKKNNLNDEKENNVGNKPEQEGFYILTERFWYLLYDAVLLRIAGERISEHDVEEELWDNGEDDDQI